MVSQEILNAMDEISKSPMIRTVSLTLRDYACPAVQIQSINNSVKDDVISLVEKNLGKLSHNFTLDFDHCNCWGNSYRGSRSDIDVSLITSDEKEEAPLPEGAAEEFIHHNFSTFDAVEEEKLAGIV